MILRTLTVESLGTNCYIVTCEQTLEAVIIDPEVEDLFETEKL